MSDSRFHLKVTFEIYGQEFTWQPSLNWSASPGECDERIVAWFVESHDKAYADFCEYNQQQDAARRAAAVEAEERAQLAALLKKYPDAAP